MKKRIWFFVFVAILLAGATRSIYAQDCSALVVDEARIFRGGISDVQSAAQKLQNLGAEVRIRTFQHGRNLDVIERDLEKRCIDWQSADQGRKNNLIVLMISVQDRQFGFYAGEQWRGVLETQYTRIENDSMVPRFRDGDFAGGFTAGLDQIARHLEVYINQPVASSQSSSPVVVKSEPVDLSGLWRVLGWIVGLIATSVLMFLLWQLKLKAERRRAAQQQALVTKQAAADRINALYEEIQQLEARAEVLKKSVSKNDFEPLGTVLKELLDLSNNAFAPFADAGKSAGDPSRPKLSQAEYEAIQHTYQKVVDNLKGAEEGAGRFKVLVNGLESTIKMVPQKIEEARKALENTAVSLTEAERNGFKTENLHTTLNKARYFLKEAKDKLMQKEFTAAFDNSIKSLDFAVSAGQLASGLHEKRDALQAEVANLYSGSERVVSVVAKGKIIFEQISSQYASSSWQSVQGNGTEAEARSAWVKNALDEARSLSSMERQEWAEAEKLISEISKRLAEAESFMRSIVALEKSLREAKKDAPAEIEAAEADIRKAWDFIRAHDDDVPDNFETELQKAEKVLVQSKTEMEQEKPDYLEVVKLAQTANTSADKILEKSRSEHEKAERLRRQAASTWRDAKAAYSKAKEYAEDHTSDMEGTTKQRLAEASVALSKIGGIASVEVQIAMAQEAEKFAKEAYKMAVRDVDEAAVTYSNSYSSHTVSGGSSGFGGSRSFGSSGGGFGGSRSFGSGGGGFGGSRGW